MATVGVNASTPVGATAVAAAQWSVSNAHKTPQAAGTSGEVNFTADEIPRLAEYSASLYAKSPEEHASYLQYLCSFLFENLRLASVVFHLDTIRSTMQISSERPLPRNKHLQLPI